MKSLAFAVLTSLTLLTSSAMAAQPSDEQLIYIGTYTGTGSHGIYASRFNPATGALSTPELVATTPNPTFLDFDARGKYLYAVNEIAEFKGKAAGAASAYAIDRATGKLTFLDQRSTVGTGPCDILLDRSGRNALVANYGSGSVAVLPIGADGQLNDASAFMQHAGKSVDASRQENPHAHCATLDRANRYAFICDLGLDKIMSYRFNSKAGTLTPNDRPFFVAKPGSGPRHLVFHPNGRFAYLITEMGNAITALAYDPKHGSFRDLQTISTLPENFQGENTGAEVSVHPSGKFLYASNRGDDSIVVYQLDPQTGLMTLVQRQSTLGKTPRHFIIAPSGKFLITANQDSNNLVVFTLDSATGRLQPTGQAISLSAPVCIKFLPQ